MKTLRIGGVTAFTTVDYPGHLAAVIFCQGCPWRCGYCHNRHLRARRSVPATRWSWERVRGFLEDRIGLLEAVVFSGGEPTLQPGLGEAMAEVRRMGFKVGLHTAGIFPKRLREILPLVDWVGLDIKAPFDGSYDTITGRHGSARLAERALEHLMASGVDYQLRTTIHPALLSSRDCKRIEAELQTRRAGPVVWQPYREAPLSSPQRK